MRVCRVAVSLTLLLALAVALTGVAHAHPMGNFSINHYSRFDIRANKISIRYIIDMAEIPTVSERAAIDRIDGSQSEARRRVVAAERSMHEVLIGFTDDRGAIAGTSDVLLVSWLGQRMAVFLDQLEATTSELAVVTERLSRYELLLGRRFISRFLDATGISRLKPGISRLKPGISRLKARVRARVRRGVGRR